MKTGIFLSYKGLGANLLHLSYCHQISKKFGPTTLITLNPKLKEVLDKDPNFTDIIYLNKFYKKISDIIGFDINIGHHRKTKRKSYKDTYDDESREIIQDFFSKDLKLFNYSF